MLNIAASDAIVACFDAKYYYWTIRPSQEDTTLVLADSVDLPRKVERMAYRAGAAQTVTPIRL